MNILECKIGTKTIYYKAIPETERDIDQLTGMFPHLMPCPSISFVDWKDWDKKHTAYLKGLASRRTAGIVTNVYGNSNLS